MKTQDIKLKIAQSFGLSNSEDIINTDCGYMIHKRQILHFNIGKLKDIHISFDTCTFDCSIILNMGTNLDFEFISCDFNQTIISGFRHQMMKNQLVFNKCIFRDRIDLVALKMAGRISFLNSFFYKDVNCYQSEFTSLILSNIVVYGNFDLRECSFKDVVFKKILFSNRVLVDQARLKEKVIFDHIRFEGGVYFEKTFFENGVEFRNNFFQNNFIFLPEESSNILFVSCFFDVNLISDFDFIKYAKNSKDQRKMFASIRSSLLKSSNTFDSYAYRVQELCIRELELAEKSRKNQVVLKEKIDKWQLWFYRVTSDHHTDTLKSFHTLIILIGIFGLLCGTVILGLDYYAFDYKEEVNILKLKEAYSSHIEYSIKTHVWRYIIGNIVLTLVFLFLFWGVVWKSSRKLLVPLGYGVVLVFFAISPKYLVPAMNFFDSKRTLLDPICTLGGLYTLLFGFLAYSFVKTICKNSIIPN